MLALLGFGFWGYRNPISTKIELGCLGLAGVLWLALGAFLASSDSADSEVECFTDVDTEQEPMTMPGFNTETYHAQYRVLEAFSFFNVILILGFLCMLLILALRHRRWGHSYVWNTSVTAYPWFAGSDAQTGKLPAPATAKRSVSTKSQRTRQTGAVTAAAPAPARAPAPRSAPAPAPAPPSPEEKPRGRSQQRPSMRRQPNLHGSPTRNEAPTYVYWIPHTPPEKAHVQDHGPSRLPRDKYLRNASPRR
ncbi:hypothetical protein EIP86_001767 [Pleurotus ostreatoroseus]|nr:hypothetical protein EIP86_001767 [Pleurotus ostreatoroseus]